MTEKTLMILRADEMGDMFRVLGSLLVMTFAVISGWKESTY